MAEFQVKRSQMGSGLRGIFKQIKAKLKLTKTDTKALKVSNKSELLYGKNLVCLCPRQTVHKPEQLNGGYDSVATRTPRVQKV